ncbi:MAG: hypothetical protein V3T84_03645 [Phycisphaerales bacterium]
MSIPVRHSGRIALAALIVIAQTPLLVSLQLFASAGSETDPPDWQIAPPGQRSLSSSFQIGPIDGLTTAWHPAPANTSISFGTFAQFYQPAAPDTIVIWTGAVEVARDDQGSTAIGWLLELGPHVVHVEVIPLAGGARYSQSRFNVVDVPIEQITVSPIDVWVDPVEIDEDLPQDEINEQTMSYFFGQSIAALRDLGHDQYRTSVNRWVHMSVEVDPPGFTPLMEWRVDGQPTRLGGSVTHAIDDVGLHEITVGPLFNPGQAEIETYSVTITSHTSGEDIIEEGEPVVFIAETDPPGYEDEITWLSSTKYGTAEPILGEGPIFIAEFNDTWDFDAENGYWQWLGVKADNATFNQDQKGEFGDMLFDNESVEIQFGENVFEEFVINGQFTVSHEGVVNGEGTVRFPDDTVGTISVVNDEAEVNYGDIKLDLVTSSFEFVIVNGEEMPFGEVMQIVQDENTFNGIGPLGDLSRAFVTISALGHTEAFQKNMQVARTCGLLSSPLSGFWCKVAVAAAVTAILILGTIACAAIVAAGCVGGMVALPVVGSIACALALAICERIVDGAAILTAFLLAEWWCP